MPHAIRDREVKNSLASLGFSLRLAPTHFVKDGFATGRANGGAVSGDRCGVPLTAAVGVVVTHDEAADDHERDKIEAFVADFVEKRLPGLHAILVAIEARFGIDTDIAAATTDDLGGRGRCSKPATRPLTTLAIALGMSFQ